MNLENLFNSMTGRSCGLCCSSWTPCENCLKSMVLGNGFDESVIDQVRGLSHVNNHSMEHWGYSERNKS